MCAIRGANPRAVLCSMRIGEVGLTHQTLTLTFAGSSPASSTTSIGHCAGTSILSNPTASVGWRLGTDEHSNAAKVAIGYSFYGGA